MNYRIIHATKTTIEQADKVGKFPKLLLDSYRVAYNEADLDGFPPETVVIEPDATPAVVVNGTTHPLVLGRDYSAAILVTRTSSHILQSAVPKPNLTTTLVDNHVRLEWDGAFEVQTMLHRSQPFVNGEPVPEDFTLIAAVDGPSVPGTLASYVDIAVEVGSGQSLAYYVANPNGVSETKIISN